MPEVALYEYGVSTQSGSFTVNIGSENGGLAGVEVLTSGEQFAFEGKVFTYTGTAWSGGQEIGFFATNSHGKLQLFSLTPIDNGAGKLTGVTEQVGGSFSITEAQSNLCFMAGTLVATPSGLVAIEALKAGDLVLTAAGTSAPVRWMGRQTVSMTFADATRVLPIRIKAGALAEGLPVRDLRVSADHALLVDGVLVQAAALVNGTSIVRDSNVPETFVYYHVELDDHALVLVEGVAAETFIDNASRMAFDNWAEHEAAFPQGHMIAELAYPRATSARQVPAATAPRLAARAVTVAGAVSTAA